MSFRFHWPTFSTSFYEHAKELLCNALNKGEKPAIIAERIQVKELDMGTIPPELEILEIGDMGTDRFRGIFRLTYAGDASISLQMKVQANPLRPKQSPADLLDGPSVMFAATPLIVPMSLRLADLKLRAIVVLVVSKKDGVTLVFKNDPLESVTVSSSFDSLAAIQAFVQKEIERQLRELFRTDLPGIVHRLSQHFVKGDSRPGQSSPTKDIHAAGDPDATIRASGSQTRPSLAQVYPSYSSSHDSLSSSSPSTPSPPATVATDAHTSSVPDAVSTYDPTYGLRSGFPVLTGRLERYRNLIRHASQGIGVAFTDFHGMPQANCTVGDAPVDAIHQLNSSSIFGTLQDPSFVPFLPSDCEASSARPSITPSPLSTETFPAVGGGTVTRPRVLHSQSSAQVSSASLASLSNVASQPSTIRPKISSSSLQGLAAVGVKTSRNSKSSVLGMVGIAEQLEEEGDEGSLRQRRLDRFASMHPLDQSVTAASRSQAQSIVSPVSARHSSDTSRFTARSSLLQKSTTSSATSLHPSSSSREPVRRSNDLDRFDSISSIGRSRSPEKFMSWDPTDPDVQFNLDPARGETCHLLATLATSNHTLSPLGRSLRHVASRSTPVVPKAKKIDAGEARRWLQEGGPPLKPKRTRVLHIGKSSSSSSDANVMAGERGGRSRVPSASTSDTSSEYSSYFPRQTERRDGTSQFGSHAPF